MLEPVVAYTVDEITGDIEGVDLSNVQELLKDWGTDMADRPRGSVDILLGINYAHLHPQQIGEAQDLRVLRSKLTGSLMLDGAHADIKAGPVRMNHLAHRYSQSMVEHSTGPMRVNFIASKQPQLTFMELEELGTVGPKRCESHVNCRNCSHQASTMSAKEQFELRLIKQNITLKRCQDSEGSLPCGW